MLKLDLIQTLALGGVVLFLGYVIRRAVPLLGRYNLPAPVIGGMTVSLLVLAARQWDVTLLHLDMTLSNPLMIAFFTTIGFAASFGLLKKGGPFVVAFFILSTIAAVLQNVVGGAAALLLGQPILFGVLCGSVTLTGGPATGLAFAEQFEEAGIDGAAAIAVAAAMGGIVAGGIMGAPIGTVLIERLRRQPNHTGTDGITVAAHVVEEQLPTPPEQVPAGEDVESFVLLKSVGIILVAMWAGSWVSAGITALNVTLPAYIGAMMVAAVLRNLDDLTGWLGLSQAVLDDIGNVALSFFLVLALMTLELWKLAAVALPLLVILLAQVALVAVYCRWPIFPSMGRDYDAAVIASGFCGFMMGTTANAMANMDALAKRYGPAPRAFLVVPLVGAFFIDFVNALIIQGCLNLAKWLG
jgi:glutamate:Na+ symporter, ESS family